MEYEVELQFEGVISLSVDAESDMEAYNIAKDELESECFHIIKYTSMQIRKADE
jgi:hypothetical protein